MIFLDAHTRKTKIMTIIKGMEMAKDNLKIEDAGCVTALIFRDIVDNSGRFMQLKHIVTQSLLRTANVGHRIHPFPRLYLALLATAVSAPLCFGKGFIGNRLVKMMFDSGAERRGGRDLFPNPLIRRNILDVGHSLKESRCFLCVVYLSGCHLILVWRFSAHSESQ